LLFENLARYAEGQKFLELEWRIVLYSQQDDIGNFGGCWCSYRLMKLTATREKRKVTVSHHCLEKLPTRKHSAVTTHIKHICVKTENENK